MFFVRLGKKMAQSTKKNLSKKTVLLASLGLLIPIFLTSMAYLAVTSDAKNQERYKREQQEIIQKIKERESKQNSASTAISTP